MYVCVIINVIDINISQLNNFGMAFTLILMSHQFDSNKFHIFNQTNLK